MCEAREAVETSVLRRLDRRTRGILQVDTKSFGLDPGNSLTHDTPLGETADAWVSAAAATGIGAGWHARFVRAANLKRPPREPAHYVRVKAVAAIRFLTGQYDTCVL